MKQIYYIFITLFLFLSACSFPSEREEMANKVGTIIYRSYRSKYHTFEHFIVVDKNGIIKVVEIGKNGDIEDIIIIPNIKYTGSENVK